MILRAPNPSRNSRPFVNEFETCKKPMGPTILCELRIRRLTRFHVFIRWKEIGLTGSIVQGVSWQAVSSRTRWWWRVTLELRGMFVVGGRDERMKGSGEGRGKRRKHANRTSKPSRASGRNLMTNQARLVRPSNKPRGGIPMTKCAQVWALGVAGAGDFKDWDVERSPRHSPHIVLGLAWTDPRAS